MIIFVRTKQATEDLAERLRARGFSAAAINGDIVQAQRERTIGQLKSGALDILVATDVAARGLDVDRISHVVNYDIPHDTESYVHRIGRTGRAGRTGDALLFVAPRERHLLKSIERTTRQPLTEIQLPTVEDVNAQRVSKFGDSITESLNSENLALFRKLIEDYEREHDVPLADIAAALAVQSRDGESFLMAPEPPAPPRREREPRERPARRFDDGGPSGPRVGRDGQEFATYRSRSASGTRSSRVRSSVRSPTRVGCAAATSGTSASDPTTAWSSCRRTCRRRPSRRCGPPASRVC